MFPVESSLETCLFVYGSAGTGKTLILCEALKIKLSQLLSQGRRVRILCWFSARPERVAHSFFCISGRLEGKKVLWGISKIVFQFVSIIQNNPDPGLSGLLTPTSLMSSWKSLLRKIDPS